MTATEGIVLDIAGGRVGGAARWLAELDRFLAAGTQTIDVIGRQHRLTSTWLVRREPPARRARLAVAANNASFAFGGNQRRVLMHNALHFSYPSEHELLARMPLRFHAQIPVVRRLLLRADVVVVPSSAMGERVQYHVPSVRDRIVVRPHPVTPVGPRRAVGRPFILVPVLPAPFKNLVPQLHMLLDTIDHMGKSIDVRVTAGPGDLPDQLTHHPRLTALGTLPLDTLAELWRSTTAVFFPSALESFGYPLAEARASGIPVVSPGTPQAHEIAGPALLPYQLDNPKSLADAIERMSDPVHADPEHFDTEAYFRWLLDMRATPYSASSQERDGFFS